MDVNLIHDCFHATLQADMNIRRQAEEQLANASLQIGFLGACLDIMDNVEVSPVVKQACSIYFKNRITKKWNTGDIDQDEKPLIRDRIMFTMVKLEKNLSNQLIPALTVIVNNDYPDSWPTFLDTILQLLSDSNNIRSIYVGILGFSELCRTFRWKKNEQRSHILDQLINNYFPSLLNLAKMFTNDPSAHDNSYEAGEIVKLVLKCYKFVTYLDLPEALQQNEAVVNWITFHVDVINMQLPHSVFKLDEEDRQTSPWVKTQKWAFHNLGRLYERYGCTKLTSKFEYPEFRSIFSTTVVPQLFQVYLSKMQLWRNGQQWMSKTALYFIVEFIEQCCVKKASWEMVLPHLNFIISDIAFFIFRPSDATLEMFEDEPQEYIHANLDKFEDSCSPENAVVALLFTLVEKRTAFTLQPLLEFVYGKLSECQNMEETIEVAKDKEAALRILGPIAMKLVHPKSPVIGQMESFISQYVFPNFQSKHGFLRARACNISSKFDDLEYNDQSYINILFQGVMSCFTEKELPVQMEAALAIQAFLKFDDFKVALGTVIVPTMEQLLELSNKIDSDVIPMVMQELVESYSDQLEPFAENLMAKLSEQVLRLLSEMHEASNVDVDDFDPNDDFSDKQTAVLGIINTMITVLLYFEKAADAIGNLEPYYSPVIDFIFKSGIDDFYAEAAELIENTLFLTRRVSQNMWTLFANFIQMLINEETTLFLEDSLPAFKNYLVYGSDMIKSNSEVQNAISQVILKVYGMDPEEDELGCNDICQASDLATNFILALDPSSASNFIPQLVQYAAKFLSFEDPAYKLDKNKIQTTDVILAALVIDPNTTIKTLIDTQNLESVFSVWFNLIEKYKRVFDIKLSLLAYLSLLSIDIESLNQLQLSNSLGQCGINIATLFVKLPVAITQLEKQRKEYEPANFNDWDGELEFDADEEFDDEADFLEAAQNGDVDFKFTESGQFRFYNDDELEEDPYSQSALENINVYTAFKTFATNIQTNEQPKYALVFGNLDANQQEVLSTTLNAA